MSKSSTKMTYAKFLSEKKPNQWAALIGEKIKDIQLQAWVASVAMWNYPKGSAWKSKLAALSEPYRANENENYSADLSRAFASVGLPYFPAKNDDAIASEKKLMIASLIHDNITNKQRSGNENARKCCNHHMAELKAER